MIFLVLLLGCTQPPPLTPLEFYQEALAGYNLAKTNLVAAQAANEEAVIVFAIYFTQCPQDPVAVANAQKALQLADANLTQAQAALNAAQLNLNNAIAALKTNGMWPLPGGG